MGLGLEKTLSLIVLIFLGVILKKKISSPDQIKGIKILILSIALPATIFIALLKIEVQLQLISLPLLALGINFLLLGGTKLLIRLLKIDTNSAKNRTLLMLIPSFAPGISCFPFLTEYLGEETLALAALADVGNKFFVLILLYLLAMHWYYKLIEQDTNSSTSAQNRLKELFKALLSEPINMVLVVAITMLCFGLNLSSLPTFLQDSVSRLSLLMTPLVLLFIGLAVKIRKGDLLLIFQVLFWRSGFAFLISGILLFLLPAGVAVSTLLLAVIFPQSACSFWPFAHMTAVKNLEGPDAKKNTFDIDLGLNILAFSLPFSTILILTICSTGSFFANPVVVLTCGFSFLLFAVVPILLSTKKKTRAVYTEQKKSKSIQTSI